MSNIRFTGRCYKLSLLAVWTIAKVVKSFELCESYCQSMVHGHYFSYSWGGIFMKF